MISVARIFVTSLVAFSYPLQVHPARRSILTLIANFRNEKESELSSHDNWIRYIIVTVSNMSFVTFQELLAYSFPFTNN